MIPRQQVSQIHGAIRVRASLPNVPELPEHFRRAMLGVALLVVLCSGLAASDGKNDGDKWRTVTIQGANNEKRWMESAFQDVTTIRGAGSYFSAEAIRGLDDYIVVALARGRTVTLCPAMVVDVVDAAYHAQWPAADTSRLLIALQETLDGRPAPQLPQLEEVVAAIRPDTNAEQLIAKMMGRGRTRSAAH